MFRTVYRAVFVVLVCLFALAPLAALPAAASSLAIGVPHAAPSSGSAWLGALTGAGLAFGMAIRIKDAGTLAKKFVQRASAAGGDYTDGVKNAGGDWETNTKAAEDNYKQGVAAAANRGAFGKGVAAAGAGKYVQRASTLGSQRYPTGIAAAEGEWAKGTQPFLQTLASMNLPPRRPKGDPGNQERANAVARALRAQKVGS